MYYEKIIKGTFIKRPNRFIAEVSLEGKVHTVHVKNTGRCKELLVPGATVYVQDHRSDMKNRKTMFSLISVEKGTKLINMDSLAPNKVVEEFLSKGKLFNDLSLIRREKTFGDSRLDFYYERLNGAKGYVEVKGVTLEYDGASMFPDAKTLRGVKHVNELIKAKEMGFESNLIFVVQLEDVYDFKPNTAAHPEFTEVLKEANEKGVNISAYRCHVTPFSLNISGVIPILL